MREFLMFALPSGFLSSVFTWWASRRKINNDVLGELQKSINLLADENKKILEENVELRKENAELKARLEETLVEIKRLSRRITELKKCITKDDKDKIKDCDDCGLCATSIDGISLLQERKDYCKRQPNKRKHTDAVITRHRKARKPKPQTGISEGDSAATDQDSSASNSTADTTEGEPAEPAR